MNTYVSLCAAALLQLAVIAGCSTAPASAPMPEDCAALAAAESAAAGRREIAEKRQHDAWRSVLPFAVVAQFAKERQAADSARRDQLDLQVRRAELGCTS